MKKIFNFWRFVISVSWAKSLTWAVTTEKESRTMLIALNIIERDNNKATELIIGPLAIIIGFVK